MSKYFLLRNLDKLVDIREQYCIDKYTSYAKQLLLNDMADFHLVPFNKDTYGVDVVR